MNGKMDRVKKKIDDIKKERDELREKYNYLVEEMKKVVDKNSQDIDFLKNQLASLGDKEVKDEEGISDVHSLINSLEKSINSLEGKHTILKEKLKEEVGLAKDALSSEVSEGMKTVRSQLVDDIKSEVEMSIENLKVAEKDIKKITDKQERFEEKISNLRSITNSLNKSLANLDNKYSLLKEKVAEDMKLTGKEINSNLIERVKNINSNIKTQLKDAMYKNVKDIQIMKENVQGMTEKSEESEEKFSKISDNINSVRSYIAGVEGKLGILKSEINDRVNSLEKEINAELSKVKGFEERLSKDVEDFEKFASTQKARMEKFESRVSNKIDMFSVEKENIKRDFSSISNDFKNIGGRLDSLREKDMDLNQQLQNLSIDTENFKKTTDEILGKLGEEQTIFKENLVAKLNEASEKILGRLSQSEIKTSSDLAKQSEEIKLFRSHVTQFINELVANYEKRFEMMKSEIDQTLRLLEERAREQSAMIFE